MSKAIIKREDLPYLEVDSIHEVLIPAKDGQPEQKLWRLRGTISDLRIVDTTSWCALLGPNRNCLYGDWVAPPGSGHKVQFETGNEPNDVFTGTQLPYAGNLYARAAILVGDGPEAWQELIFESSDAVATRFVDEDGKAWRQLTESKEGRPLEPEAEILPDAWDHEHCLICNAHIDPDDRFYRHQYENEFLCVACYERYLVTGDLSFLIKIDEGPQPPETTSEAHRN
ncbi:MAG TPA: hypothetical protein VKB38_00565 [Terracidiphilus sp.]|nr:hypothetical protein [Terracidiphilus sp.]